MTITNQKTPAANRRLARWRVKWLIEHFPSHQFLLCVDSFLLRNTPLCQTPNPKSLAATKHHKNQHLRSSKTGIKAANRINAGGKLGKLCPELAKILKIIQKQNRKNIDKLNKTRPPKDY